VNRARTQVVLNQFIEGILIEKAEARGEKPTQQCSKIEE
jgi:hypothetical protein